jgi:hypothetical protein
MIVAWAAPRKLLVSKDFIFSIAFWSVPYSGLSSLFGASVESIQNMIQNGQLPASCCATLAS